MTRARGLLTFAGAAIGLVALAACSSAPTGSSASTDPGTGPSPTASSASPSASPSLDCTAVRRAMDDYSAALKGLATSLEAGDAMAAVGAADAMAYSLDLLEKSLPGIPAKGLTFLATSRSVALQVKQSAANSPEMTGLVTQLTTSFADPDFAAGGEAIDGYADAMCPDPSPSAS